MPQVKLFRKFRLFRSLALARAVRFFHNLNKIYNIYILVKKLLAFFRTHDRSTHSITKYEINEFDELTPTTPRRLDRSAL